MATHPFDFDRYIVPNYGLQLVKNTLYGKFANLGTLSASTESDFFTEVVNQIKTYTNGTYVFSAAWQYTSVYIITANKVSNTRIIGSAVPQMQNGRDMVGFSYEGTTLNLYPLALKSHIVPKNLTVDYSTSAFTSHAVVGMKLGCSLLIYGNFANSSAATKGTVAVVKSCYPITNGTMAMPVQCDDGSVQWLSFATSGDDLIIQTIQNLTAGKYVRFYGVIPCDRP